MATSAMKPSPVVSHLDKYSLYRDMMSCPAPTKKPICAKYQKGECNGLRCPYFHPKDLVVEKPTQPAPQKTTPSSAKLPREPAPNPVKPPTAPTPKTSTTKSPQSPKKDKKPVAPPIAPERPEQKPAPANSRLVKSRTPQDPPVSTRAPRQPRSSPPTSGAQTKARASNFDGGPMVPHVKNLNNSTISIVVRPQTAVSRTTAVNTITIDETKPAPTQQISSGSSTSGTSASPKKNKRKKKKVQAPENPTTETRPPPPESVSSEQGSIPEPRPVLPDPKHAIPSKRYICRNYLHKQCSRYPCPHYHDPSLVGEPPLCKILYTSPCTRDVCSYYHPEGNRRQTVCINFLNSRCYYPDCRRYHFRLPVDEVTPVQREQLTVPLGPRTGHTVPINSGGANRQPVPPQTNWSLSPPVSSTDIGLHQNQCPSWNDGYCPEGGNCKMVHLPQVERWQMEAAQAAAKTMDRPIFGTTKVVFGAGCEIKQVTTALESCRVLISNLPSRTTREGLEALLARAGFNREAFRILVLRVSISRRTQEASVIFDDPRDAKAVVEALDKKDYYDEVLKFELAPAVKRGQMDDYTYNRSSYLEITFSAPSMQVQAIYPTVQDAIEKAKALNGGNCWGRTVRVTVARPPQPHETWTYIKNSIVISNVAVDTPDSTIRDFSDLWSMKTFSHRRFRVDMALRRLETHMRTVGGLKPGDFEVVQNPRKGVIFVRGRFDTWGQADKVWQSLQETDLEFLARDHAHIFLAFPHQYSLHIPLRHYDAQKEIYDRLESQHGRDRTAHIVATRYRMVCLIQVVGIDKKAVGALKMKVERIAQGELVGVWDRFFLNWEGAAFFGRLQRLFGAYVRHDSTKQVLRVYGSETAVDHARQEIEEQMRTLAALDYRVTIEDHCVGFFIHQGIKTLGDMLGEDNVWLHTTSKPYFVSVRGGHDAEHALRKLVHEALKKPLRPHVRGWSRNCPLCFEEPTQPFPLACQHIYCTGCLKHMLISATDGQSVPICCIGNEGRCKTPIPLPVMERFVSLARLTQIFESSFRVYLAEHPNEYRFCPTPDCTQIYRVSKEDSVVIQCPACLIDTCSHCHKPPHRELTCEENTLIGSKSGQEQLLERWANGHQNVKKCPDCGVLIEKIDGCNHIHCRCGGHVCWICAKTFNNGIYDHLNAVHGGAYDADH